MTAAGGVLTIDLDAIASNWRTLRDLSRPATCAAVVKADAYGLGLEPVGQALYAAGARQFFVARAEEGFALRNTLDAAADIYVLDGPGDPKTARRLATAGLIPVLNSLEDIACWGHHAELAGQHRAILAIDTGMTRLGLSPAEARNLMAESQIPTPIRLDYVMTHLACADEPGNTMNTRQQRQFDELKTLFPGTPASVANSAGIFLGPGFHYQMTRPGAALYGLNVSPRSPVMRPVVSLKARILQIRNIDQDVTVGYGATCEVPPGHRLATVAAGYADGYLRSLSNRGYGYIGDVRVPVAGRVSMDMTVFDISGTGEVASGDYIDLICDKHSVDEVASDADTIGYEILTSLGRRYERVYKRAESV